MKENHRFVRIQFFLIVWMATGLFAPGTGMAAGSGPQNPSSRALRNLVAFTPNLEKSLISVSENQRMLIFRIDGEFSQSRLAMIAVDSLLLAPAGRKFPDGLAVRVRSLRRERNTFEVMVTPVTMADLLGNQPGQDVAIRAEDIEETMIETIPVTPMAIRLPTGLQASTETGALLMSAPATAARTGDKGIWSRVRETAVFSSGARLEWNSNGITGNARLRVENPALVFRRDQLSFSGKIILETGLGFSPARGVSFKHTVLKIRLKPIILGMLGPIPLYVRPRLRVLVKGRLSGSIGCSGAFSFTAPFVTGARRESGSWKNISQATMAVKPRKFSLEGNVGELSAKLFVGVAVDFFINDLAGPSLRTGLYVTPGAAATLLRSPAGERSKGRPILSVFKVKGGAELSIGGALNFFDNARFLVDIVRVEVPLYKLKLDGISVDPQQLSVHQGMRVDPSTLLLVPRYRQRLLEQDQENISLSPIPGIWGLWDPAPDQNNLLPGLSAGSQQEFSVSLSLLDKALAVAPGKFTLSVAP